MKVLKSFIDFMPIREIELEIGSKVLIKQSTASGWGRLAKVIRLTPKQVEVEVINVIPTEESNRFGTKNGLKDRGELGGFFEDWAFRKKCAIGKKEKFWKSNAQRVGETTSWNSTVLCEII